MKNHHPVKATFGKHRGECATCIADADPDYVSWCLGQAWFAEQHPELFQAWQASGISPKKLCPALTTAGNPCQYWAKHGGPLCTIHYKQAEKAMMAEVDAMAAEWEQIAG